MENQRENRPRKRNRIKRIIKSHDGRYYVISNKIFHEIRKLQRLTDPLIPRASFLRVIREVLQLFFPPEFRIQKIAVQALQEACELYMSQFFEDCVLTTTHAKRVTLKIEDFRLVRRLRGVEDVINH